MKNILLHTKCFTVRKVKIKLQVELGGFEQIQNYNISKKT